MRLILRWLINAVSLLVVAYFVPGFVVHSFMDALIAALVLGLVNATLGAILPLTILTLGLFLIILNAVMLKIAAALVAGFEIRTWTAAIIGAILLSLVSSVLHWLTGTGRHEPERR